MINTYEEYLSQRKILSIEQMYVIHTAMIEDIGADQDALVLYDELIEAVTKYAAVRAEWILLSREEKMDMDLQRTSYHDSVIMYFNMLSRYLKQQGKPAGWRDALGYPEEDDCRKTIGDFACYLVFVNSINAR